jgi:hypothetical protein
MKLTKFSLLITVILFTRLNSKTKEFTFNKATFYSKSEDGELIIYKGKKDLTIQSNIKLITNILRVNSGLPQLPELFVPGDDTPQNSTPMHTDDSATEETSSHTESTSSYSARTDSSSSGEEDEKKLIPKEKKKKKKREKTHSDDPKKYKISHKNVANVEYFTNDEEINGRLNNKSAIFIKDKDGNDGISDGIKILGIQITFVSRAYPITIEQDKPDLNEIKEIYEYIERKMINAYPYKYVLELICDYKKEFINNVYKKEDIGECAHKCTKEIEKKFDALEKNKGHLTDYSFFLVKVPIKQHNPEEALRRLNEEVPRYLKAKESIKFDENCEYDYLYREARSKLEDKEKKEREDREEEDKKGEKEYDEREKERLERKEKLLAEMKERELEEEKAEELVGKKDKKFIDAIKKKELLSAAMKGETFTWSKKLELIEELELIEKQKIEKINEPITKLDNTTLENEKTIEGEKENRLVDTYGVENSNKAKSSEEEEEGGHSPSDVFEENESDNTGIKKVMDGVDKSQDKNQVSEITVKDSLISEYNNPNEVKIKKRKKGSASDENLNSQRLRKHILVTG